MKTKEILKKYRAFELSLEDAIEEMGVTAPALLNDDNGHYAFCGTAYQNVCFGKYPIDISIQHFVEKKYWKQTVRKAFIYYLSTLK